MKVASVWQPYASLIIQRHKFIETRSWPAPKSVIGKRIAIASTKTIKPEQRAAMVDPEFAGFYAQTGMPALEELPHGYLLGTVELHSCLPIDEQDFDMITAEEKAFGWWKLGYYAWRLRDPIAFDRPIPCRGAQGLWDWTPDEQNVQTLEVARGAREKPQRQAPLRDDLPNAVGCVVLFGKPTPR